MIDEVSYAPNFERIHAVRLYGTSSQEGIILFYHMPGSGARNILFEGFDVGIRNSYTKGFMEAYSLTNLKFIDCTTAFQWNEGSVTSNKTTVPVVYLHNVV